MIPKSYTVRSCEDSTGDHHLKSWVIEVSNDGSSWSKFQMTGPRGRKLIVARQRRRLEQQVRDCELQDFQGFKRQLPLLPSQTDWR